MIRVKGSLVCCYRDALAGLRAVVEALRRQWHAAGRGEEFEELVEEYRAEGNWPFDA